MPYAIITAAGRAFVSLRVAGIVPDGTLCNMDTGVEHGPQLPTMDWVNAYNRQMSAEGRSDLGDYLVPPYNLLAI